MYRFTCLFVFLLTPLALLASEIPPDTHPAAESVPEITQPAPVTLPPEGDGEIWVDHRELSDAEKRTGLRFDRGWFMLGHLGGGFWQGRYLTSRSPGAYLTPDGYLGTQPSEVNIVYNANVGVGRFITPRWSLEINFAASVGIHDQDGVSPAGIPNPAGSGTRVSSVSLYHLRNRFYLYDFDAERRFYVILGGGVTQFNDAYFLPGRPKAFDVDNKATFMAPSLSTGAGLTVFDTSMARLYLESSIYQTFSTKYLDSNQVYTFGAGFSFPLDGRVYTEADVQVATLRDIHGRSGTLIMVETDPLAPVTPGMSGARIMSPEEMRLIGYRRVVEGPQIPKDALEPPVHDGLDYAVDTLVLSAMVIGFKRALNITGARGMLKGAYSQWPDHVSVVPPWNDGNPFYTNWILHPYAGALYYMYYRDRGYSRIASSIGSFLVSAFHEYIAEAVYEPASGIDLIITPGLGVPLGMLMDETSVRWARSSSTPKKIAAYFMNPMLGMPFARFRRGPYYDPAKDPVFSLQWNWNF